MSSTEEDHDFRNALFKGSFPQSAGLSARNQELTGGVKPLLERSYPRWIADHTIAWTEIGGLPGPSRIRK